MNSKERIEPTLGQSAGVDKVVGMQGLPSRVTESSEAKAQGGDWKQFDATSGGANAQKFLAAPAPFLRLFAKALDLQVYFGLFFLVFMLYAYVKDAEGAGDLLNQIMYEDKLARSFSLLVFHFLLLPALLLDGMVLAVFGTTLGKLIFGIKVRRADGSKLTIANGLSRGLSIFIKGFAFGIPFLYLITVAISIAKLFSKGYTSWDKQRYVVTKRRLSLKHFVLVFLGLVLLLPAPFWNYAERLYIEVSSKLLSIFYVRDTSAPDLVTPSLTLEDTTLDSDAVLKKFATDYLILDKALSSSFSIDGKKVLVGLRFPSQFETQSQNNLNPLIVGAGKFRDIENSSDVANSDEFRQRTALVQLFYQKLSMKPNTTITITAEKLCRQKAYWETAMSIKDGQTKNLELIEFVSYPGATAVLTRTRQRFEELLTTTTYAMGLCVGDAVVLVYCGNSQLAFKNKTVEREMAEELNKMCRRIFNTLVVAES